MKRYKRLKTSVKGYESELQDYGAMIVHEYFLKLSSLPYGKIVC